jgi:hypothetical protein
LFPQNAFVIPIQNERESGDKRLKRGYKEHPRLILACYEFVGDIALKIAPLVKHRNETIHQYLKINWQNIITVKDRLPDIREFIERAKEVIFQ